MVFTASLLGAQHKRDSVEDKSASLLVVSLGKVLNGMPPPLCNNKWWDQVVYPSWWRSLTKDTQTEHELIRINECYKEINPDKLFARNWNCVEHFCFIQKQKFLYSFNFSKICNFCYICLKNFDIKLT